jgi:hypothetical protein
VLLQRRKDAPQPLNALIKSRPSAKLQKKAARC